MALGFSVVAAPDAHIHFLQQHPGLVDDYLEGAKPQSVAESLLPDRWPQQPPAPLNAWGVNHRNADLYHWILNGRQALASGSGSLFQVWYEPDALGAAVKLDAHNVHFALTSRRIPELALLAIRVNLASVKQSFTDWCVSQGKDYQPDDMACQSFIDEFAAFGRGLREVLRRGEGIIW